MSSKKCNPDTLEVKTQAAKFEQDESSRFRAKAAMDADELGQQVVSLAKRSVLESTPYILLAPFDCKWYFFEVCGTCSYNKDGFGYGLHCTMFTMVHLFLNTSIHFLVVGHLDSNLWGTAPFKGPSKRLSTFT